MEAVSPRVSRLELNQKLMGCLIRIGFKALVDFSPVIFEHAGTATTWLVAIPSVRLRADGDTPNPSVFAPAIDAPGERSVLLRAEAAWELDAQLLKELLGGLPLPNLPCRRSSFWTVRG